MTQTLTNFHNFAKQQLWPERKDILLPQTDKVTEQQKHIFAQAGDFLPAILQDNGRAMIMGERTAGAGGYIEKISFPNLSGISELDLTASYAER